MRKQSYSENAPNLPPSEVKKEPPLSNRRNLSLPPNPLEEGSDAIEFLKSAKKLTAEDVVVMYAYAEAIVETVREPLIILDRDLRIKTANKSFFDTFQITKQNTYDRYFFDLGNGQWDIPDLKRLLKKILPKNSKFNDFEVTHEFNHIGKRTMILNARQIILEGYKTKLILLAIEDVTDRREKERRLRESEQHYRWIVEQVKEHVIYSMDKTGRIMDWNKAAEQITGYKKEEVLGKFHSLLYNPKDQKESAPLEELKVAVKKGKAANERWHMGKDGHLFWGSGLVTTLKDDEGNLRGFLKIMRDITLHKEEEQRKDDFLSMASHELKTPTTSIKAYTEILKKRLTENKDNKNIPLIKSIDDQTNKLISLINDFLDLSKIESGKFLFSKKKFDLDKLIKKIAEDFQYMTETHQIKSIGEVKSAVKGDRDRIGQVLINLLTNAIKYSPQGKVVIIRSSVNKGFVTVSVQDFGIGIPKSKQKNIFDKYFQIDGRSEVGKHGFGLGLYITSEIIKRHGGEIGVESDKGKGSTFYFTLPIKG